MSPRFLAFGFVVTAAFAALGGCASTVLPRPAPASHEPMSPAPPPSRRGALADAGSALPAAPGAYTHAASGMQFPAELAGFERDRVDHFDASQDDITVAYHRVGADVALMTAVYVYPVARFEGGLERHYEESKAAVLDVPAGGELIAEGTMRFEQDGVPHPGLRAHFLLRDPAGALPARISHLFLFQHGRWFIKYRAMFVAAQHEASDRALAEFMRALVWPDGGPTLVAQWIEAEPVPDPAGYRPTK